MSEFPSSGPNSSRLAQMSGDKRCRLTLATVAILFFLTLAVVILRFHRLSELPPGLFFDEGANGLDALQVLQGEHAIYFPRNNGREPLGIYLTALAISILGRTELAVRIPTALASSGTVFAVFWLGWLLFGRDERDGTATPWRGLLVGGLAAGLLAVSLGQTVIGRTAFRVNFLPLILCLCVALLWEGWQRRSWPRIALAGACAGLLAYTYIAARLTPLLFLLFGISTMLTWAASENGGELRERGLSSLRFSALTSRLRAEIPLAGVFVGVAAVVSAPIVFYFFLNPDQFFARSDQISVFQSDKNLEDLLRAFFVNAWEHLFAFGIRGDPNLRHNFPGQPMLNIWEAFFFWLGVAAAVWRWRQPAFRLLLLWLTLLLLPAMLSRDGIVPHFLRMLGATPAVYLLTSAGVWETARLLRNRFFSGHENSPLLGKRGESRAGILLGVVVGGVLLAQGVHTYRSYFQEWATAPELNEEYEQIWTDLAIELNENPSKTGTVYLIGLTSGYAWHNEVSTHPGFEYLYTGAAATRILHVTATHNLAPKISSALDALEQVSTVHYVDWDNSLVGGNDHTDRLITAILEKYGRYLNSESRESFQIHSYADIELDRLWTYYEKLEPLTVHYDGGISFRGFALGRGTEQFSLNQPIELDMDRYWWIATHWSTAPDLEAIYSISLRLHDSEGSVVYQYDAVLENSRSLATNRWQADELVDTLHILEFPPELPPGDYELRLVVYDFETFKPTVELGVWEPETVLTSLQLSDDR